MPRERSKGGGLLLLPAAHRKVKISRAANAAHQSDRGTDHNERKGNIRGGISKHANASSNEKLVYHIIQGADQHGDNAWNRKAD